MGAGLTHQGPGFAGGPILPYYLDLLARTHPIVEHNAPRRKQPFGPPTQPPQKSGRHQATRPSSCAGTSSTTGANALRKRFLAFTPRHSTALRVVPITWAISAVFKHCPSSP